MEVAYNVIETPEWATNVMYEQMSKEVRKQYANISNAHLEVVSGLSQPVWVMELYDYGQVTALAILEAPCRNAPRYFYIVYAQQLVHRPIIDEGQVYSAPIGGYDAHILSNKIGEVCVEWE